MRWVVSPLSVLLLVVLSVLTAPDPCSAQSAVPDREALVRLRVDRGGKADEVDALIRIADEAAAKGLPVGPVTNKIREGLAKGEIGRAHV